MRCFFCENPSFFKKRQPGIADVGHINQSGSFSDPDTRWFVLKSKALCAHYSSSSSSVAVLTPQFCLKQKPSFTVNRLQVRIPHDHRHGIPWHGPRVCQLWFYNHTQKRPQKKSTTIFTIFRVCNMSPVSTNHRLELRWNTFMFLDPRVMWKNLQKGGHMLQPNDYEIKV